MCRVLCCRVVSRILSLETPPPLALAPAPSPSPAGVILWELATNQEPWSDRNAMQVGSEGSGGRSAHLSSPCPCSNPGHLPRPAPRCSLCSHPSRLLNPQCPLPSPSLVATTAGGGRRGLQRPAPAAARGRLARDAGPGGRLLRGARGPAFLQVCVGLRGARRGGGAGVYAEVSRTLGRFRPLSAPLVQLCFPLSAPFFNLPAHCPVPACLPAAKSSRYSRRRSRRWARPPAPASAPPDSPTRPDLQMQCPRNPSATGPHPHP